MLKSLEKMKSEKCSRHRAPRGLVSLFLALVFILLSSTAQAANFTASLDRNSIVLGESVTLTLNFEGGTPAKAPSLTIPNVRISNQGTSQQFVSVNGQFTSS